MTKTTAAIVNVGTMGVVPPTENLEILKKKNEPQPASMEKIAPVELDPFQ